MILLYNFHDFQNFALFQLYKCYVKTSLYFNEAFSQLVDVLFQ